MASIAECGGTDMGYRLSRGNDAIMATDTTALHLRMINRGRQHSPACGAMTTLTIIRRVDVCAALARGVDTIVATGAGADHLRVIYRAGGDGCPLGGMFLMTQFTGICGIDVCG